MEWYWDRTRSSAVRSLPSVVVNIMRVLAAACWLRGQQAVFIVLSLCVVNSLVARYDTLKANSHIPYRSHAAPMLFHCHAVPLSVQIVSFPFDLQNAAVFDSQMPCRARAMPRQCCSESDFSRPRHSAAWAWHGMCELASTVQRRHVGNLPAFGFFRLPSGVPRSLLSEAYQSVKL
jgi:hypothetical protein